jgi:hypothetical protein
MQLLLVFLHYFLQNNADFLNAILTKFDRYETNFKA